MKQPSYHIGLISKYRSVLMGIATIGILMCHASSYDVHLPYHLNSVLELGQIGVMIFFFVSGFGLYYSTRSIMPGLGNLLSWYRKRLVRLFIPYLIVFSPALYLMHCKEGIDWTSYFIELSTLSYWINHTGCWFVCVLVPLYLITPIWSMFMDKVKYNVVPTLIVFFAMMCVENGLGGAFHQASFFFIGFWVGQYSKRDAVLSFKYIILGACSFVTLLFSYYLFGFGQLLPILTIPSIVLLSQIPDWMKSDIVERILRFFGNISLESYLLNVTLIVWIDYFGLIPDKFYPYRYLFIVIIGIVLAYMISKISKRIIPVIT